MRRRKKTKTDKQTNKQKTKKEENGRGLGREGGGCSPHFLPIFLAIPCQNLYDNVYLALFG